MRAALKALVAMGRGRRTWAVLGDMLELGDESTDEHDAIGRLAVRLNVSRLVVVGDLARPMATGAQHEGSWGDEVGVGAGRRRGARAAAQKNWAPATSCLFKASRDAGLRWLGDRVAGEGAAAGAADQTDDDTMEDAP